MVPIEWRRTAVEDLWEIVAYVAARNPAAAEALHQDIEAKVARLAHEPKLYRPGRVAGTREMVVRRSYIVVYRESTTRVSILRVLHAARQWP